MELAHDVGRGFSDKMLSAQSTFRVILDALARPGSVHRITGDLDAPAELMPAAAALALTLFDHDTPVWRDRALNTDAVARWLRFHTGAPLTGNPGQSAFALVGDSPNLGALEGFAPGSGDYPDRSTTLVLQVESLTTGRGLVLSGPGINGMARLAPSPLPDGFFASWDANRTLFPCGVDIVFAAGDCVAALPRTTRVSLSEA